MGIEVEGIRNKTKDISILTRFKRTFLRLYRADLALEDSLVGQKRIARKAAFAHSYHASQRETRRAMLRAEHCRAMVLMERQKHQRLY